MANAQTSRTIVDSAVDFLDFVFDSSGWTSVGERVGLRCAKGAVCGFGAFAASLGGNDSPVSADALNAMADFAGTEVDVPLILVMKSCEVADEPGQIGALTRLLAALVRRRKSGAIIAVVLGDLIGPAAMLARMVDIICFGPSGGVALADAETSQRVSSPNGAGIPAGLLNITLKTDAVALLAARRIAGLLSTVGGARSKPFVIGRSEDTAIEHLAGSDTERHVDERRLLQRITDDRTFTEFDSSSGLTAFLAEIGGQAIGVLASSAKLSGVLDARSLAQASALVAFCGRHSLPVLTLVDCPGAVPDDATLGALTNLVAAWEYSEVYVISLVVRKAIGVASTALMPFSAKVLYWPDAKVGLLRDSACSPDCRAIAIRGTRTAIIETLASLREPAV